MFLFHTTEEAKQVIADLKGRVDALENAGSGGKALNELKERFDTVQAATVKNCNDAIAGMQNHFDSAMEGMAKRIADMEAAKAPVAIVEPDTSEKTPPDKAAAGA